MEFTPRESTNPYWNPIGFKWNDSRYHGECEKLQFLGVLRANEHAYDLFVDFRIDMGVWKPYIYVVSKKGAGSYNLYSIIREPVTSDPKYVPLAFAQKYVKENWWVILNRNPRSDI